MIRTLPIALVVALLPAGLAAETRHAALLELRFQAGQNQDPADALWRQAREEMNKANYRRAADLFQQLIGRYNRSAHAPDAYYWQAFALYRTNSTDQLEAARRLLELQRSRYPQASTRTQAAELLVRVRTELAQRGDADAAEEVTRNATRVLQQGCPAREDDDIREAALQSLLQMDAANAIPMLKGIMAKKDACSAPLRRKAVFLISQKRSAETEDMLLEAARNDPDREVREQAVFWLGQVNTEKALSAIEGVLNSSTDADVQEKAIFALSQHRSPRASQILREWAQGGNRPAQLREKAIFWLSQQRDAENGRFLRELYAKLPEENLKERVIFALSQRRGEGNERWMMDLALNANENIELRKKALFWAGQMRTTPIADFITLYDRSTDREIKEQLIFVFSQRRESEVVDKLMDIARNDKDRELRKKAIFWLGQSKDPRAAKFLQDVIGD